MLFFLLFAISIKSKSVGAISASVPSLIQVVSCSLIKMSSDNKGLTVGELTIAIGSLIIAILIWSSFNKEGINELVPLVNVDTSDVYVETYLVTNNSTIKPFNW